MKFAGKNSASLGMSTYFTHYIAAVATEGPPFKINGNDDNNNNTTYDNILPTDPVEREQNLCPLKRKSNPCC